MAVGVFGVKAARCCRAGPIIDEDALATSRENAQASNYRRRPSIGHDKLKFRRSA